jgi:hypothetical protein
MHEFFQNLSWIFSVLIGCLWVTIGLLLAGLGWSALRKWFVSARWSAVPARIVASEIKADRQLDDHLMYRPVVRYTIAAAGREVSGYRLAFVGKFYASEAHARRVIEKYPAGMVVMARGNPQNPSESVLERSGAAVGFSLLLLGLALATAPLGVAARFGLPVWPLAVIVAAVAALALLLDRASRVRVQRARQAGLYPEEGQGDDSDVEKLLSQGEKLLAIRLYRELHGTDLKTARCRVETLQQKQPSGLQS